MATYILQFSRSLSHHAPIYRTHYFIYGNWKKIFTKCASWHPPMYTEIEAHLPMTIIQARFYSKRSSKMFTVKSNVDVLRKNLSSNEASDDVSNVVPIGIIIPKNKNGTNMKIVIVPLDMRSQGKNSLAKTLVALEELHAHAHEIDEFTNKMIDDCQKNEISEESQQEQKRKTRRTASVDEVYFWKNSDSQENNVIGGPTVTDDIQASAFTEVGNLAQVAITDIEPITPSRVTFPSLANTPNTFSVNPNVNVSRNCPEPQPSELPFDDPEDTYDPADAILDTDVDLVTVDVPSDLNQHLNDLAISSMQLSVKMDITDVNDAIMHHGEDTLEKLQPTLGEDAMVSFNTIVEPIPQSEPEQTVPLQFSALISGTVQLDVVKLKVEQLTDEHVPNYQDSVTSVAASVCGSALQTNIAELCHAGQSHKSEMMPWFSYLMTKGYMDVQQQQALRLDDPFKKNKHSSPTTGIENNVQITASSEKGKEPCAKKGANGSNAKKDPSGKNGGEKKDPCAKDGGEKKDASAKDGGQNKDPCAKGGDDKKKDPCAVFKKGKDNVEKKDPCGKDGGEKKDPCAKDGGEKKDASAKDGAQNKDPCAKEGDDKKKDPCAKDAGEKKDASAKDSGQNKDPCAKGDDKKKDPCAQFKKGKEDDKKKDPCAKDGGEKKDPCSKDGEGGDGKKKDPCAQFMKGKDDKKKDPCGKDGVEKKDTSAKDGAQKKDPCAKESKADDCKKKDPCDKFTKGKDDGKKKDSCGKDGGEKKDASAKHGAQNKDPCGKGADDKKKDPCAQFKKGKDDKKTDPCAKDGGEKKDPCSKAGEGGDGKKKDPCAQFMKGKDDKKKDPCGKDGVEKKDTSAKDGAQKKDPCAKESKADDCKKKDPCDKFTKGKDDGKKKDSCGKDGGEKKDASAKDGAQNKDPCGKGADAKKKDPCAQFKKGKDDKKTDPCTKDGGEKKDASAKDGAQNKDPCAKGGEDKKKDPCAKDAGEKKDASAKDGAQNKDPCAKGGEDKKKDPCAKDAGEKKDASAKDGAQNKDPCAKGGDDKKKDPCGHLKKGKDDGEKKDACAKDGAQKKDPCAKDGDGKKKDPCAPLMKSKDDGQKKDPCDKDGAEKKDASAKDSGQNKDPCAKGDDDKKKDPCAQFAKGKGGKKKDPCGKDGGEKKDPCGKGDDKKKDPCAKFAKGKDGGKKKDPCSKDGGDKKDPCRKDGGEKKDACAKDGAQKKDPCAKESKGGDGCGKDGGQKKNLCGKSDEKKKSPCPKSMKYSTHASLEPKYYYANSFYKPKRYVCSSSVSPPKLPSFKIHLSLARRRYSGKPSKMKLNVWGLDSKRNYAKKEDESKHRCKDFVRKEKPRKDKKARTALRTDCFATNNECKKPTEIVVKCSNAQFPRKNCPKDNKIRPPPIIPKKPEKKIAPICAAYKKKKGDEERNSILKPNAIVLNQIRNQSNVTINRGYISQVKPLEKDDFDESCKSREVITIPVSYQICKETLPVPELRPYDVLLRTGSIALSGSDIHVYENSSRNIENISLGHDATGFVEEVGCHVKSLHVGDRVVMESALSCGLCDYCKRGECNICSDLVYNGFLTTYQTHPADLCHRLPDSISMKEGTLIQTLAMGCQACFKANITPISNLLIIGSTPTAVSAAMCATAMGAKQVIIADSMISALERVKYDFGFDTIHYESNAPICEVLEAVHQKFRGWPNCVINCAISSMSMSVVVMALEPSSVCVLSECESENTSLNALEVLMKNIRLIPSFRCANMYPTALQLMKSGHAPVGKFIAKIYPWSELDAAFQCAQNESNIGFRKVLVENI